MRYSLRFLFIWIFVWGGIASDLVAEERELSFYQTHTHERLTVVYKRDGRYLDEALGKISHIMRDHRTDDVHRIDPKLLDWLYDLLSAVNNHGEVHIISAYRSPETNSMLRARSAQSGVAKRSQHMLGKALDFRLPGTETKLLRDTAWNMQRGGVGYYPALDFIQIDTGRVRWW